MSSIVASLPIVARYLLFSTALMMISAAFEAGKAIFACLTESASTLGFPKPEFSVMLVAMAPGCTTVTCTFVSLSSAYRPKNMN